MVLGIFKQCSDSGGPNWLSSTMQHHSAADLTKTGVVTAKRGPELLPAQPDEDHTPKGCTHDENPMQPARR